MKSPKPILAGPSDKSDGYWVLGRYRLSFRSVGIAFLDLLLKFLRTQADAASVGLRPDSKSLREPKEIGMQDRMRGEAEEIKGKVTGDKGLQVKGKARQKVGRVKEVAKAMAYDVEHPKKKR
jgi:uncharacterized protein YjbJ (UPF0337 family)